MKRIAIIILMAALIMGTYGCTMNNGNNSDKIKVVTTIFAAYDFARAVGGDKVEVDMLIKPGTEFHSYEPTPQDIIKIKESDLFIYVGGENDEWVDEILDSLDDEINVLKLMDCVDRKYYEEVKDGMEEEHEHDEDENHDDHDEHEEWDEHVWNSPANAISICKKTAQKLVMLDEDNTTVYEKNCNSYCDKISEIDRGFHGIVNNSVNKTLVFGDRFPLRYFVEEYGLDYYAAFPGCSANTEASAATIAFLIDKVKENNIKTVFKIELSNSNIANTIAKANDAKVKTFYSMHNITKEDFDNGETYCSLMQRNLDSLKEALG